MKKILVIRFGALGDLFQMMPCFQALRQHYGEGAHLTLLTLSQFSLLFETCPWFDEVMTIKKRPRHLDFIRIYHLSHIIGLKKFDIVIDLQMNRITKRLYHFMKHRGYEWYGFSGKNAIDQRVNRQFSSYIRNEKILEKMGINNPPFADLEMQWLDAPFDEGMNKKISSKYCIFFMGAAPKHPQKRWAQEHFIRLAQKLNKDGYDIVLIGGADDQALNQAFLKSLPNAQDFVHNFGQALDWAQTARLMRGAKLMVSNDSGPAYLSCLLGCPTWILFHAKYDYQKHLLPFDHVYPLQAKAEFMLEPDIVHQQILAQLG